MKAKVKNLNSVKEARKTQRNNLTPAEATLWRYLKASKMGKKFRRQHSVGPYVLDFYCPSEKMAIELDGDQHFTAEGLAHDKIRTNYLKRFGIRVVRFANVEVLDRTDAVLEEVKQVLEK